MQRAAVVLASVSLLVGCGNDVALETSGAGGAGGSGSASTATGMDTTATSGTGGSHGEWVPLVQSSWTIAPASEEYQCVLVTIQETTYITSFRALAPPGTHHTVVVVAPKSGNDMTFPCSALTLSDKMIFTSGIGTDDMVFPPGVAMRINAGDQVLLNLHLFNTSTSELSGTSGTLIKTIDPGDVQERAEVVFGGTLTLDLPPMQTSQATGRCNFTQDATLMSIWPHMHQYGTHMVVTHESLAGDVVLHDDAYDFNEQLNYPIDSLVVQAGEGVRVTCTYENTSSSTVHWGDSSNAEMCFAGLYRYPAADSGLFCVSN